MAVPKALGNTNSPFRKFLAWWFRELLHLLPRQWQQSLAYFEQMPLYVWRNSSLIPANENQRSGRDGQVLIGLSVERVQLIRMTLPAAIEPRLHQSLALQISRHTPFLPDQVLFDCFVEKRESQRLEVLLAIVPKALVVDVLASARELGLNVGCLSVQQEATEGCLPLNFLKRGENESQDGRSFWSRRGLLMVLVLILAMGGFIFWSEYRDLQALQLRVDALSSDALEAVSLQKELTILDARARFLGDRRAYTNSLAWLTELTRILPDQVWLTEVHRSGPEVRIVGEAADAFGLLLLIDASLRFEQSRFNAPMRRDGVREQFDLSFAITPNNRLARPVQADSERP